MDSALVQIGLGLIQIKFHHGVDQLCGQIANLDVLVGQIEYKRLTQRPHTLIVAENLLGKVLRNSSNQLQNS